MLVVKVEIWPGGRREGARELGRVGIANVSQLAEVSDYVAIRVDDTGSEDRGVVRAHARGDGFWPLVHRATAPVLGDQVTRAELDVIDAMRRHLA